MVGIINLLEALHDESELNFRGLIGLIQHDEIPMTNVKLKCITGMGTIHGVYIDFETLAYHNNEMLFYIVLHEICHYKRIVKLGKEYHISYLSSEDFDEYCDHIIYEEIIADRWATSTYLKLNGTTYPMSNTQQLHLKSRQNDYKSGIKEYFGKVQNDENKYNELMESFIRD